MTGEQPVAVFDVANLLHAANTLNVFVSKLTAGLYASSKREHGLERRALPRFLLSVIVEVQPMDEDLKLQDLPFRIVTRDLSFAGIGMQGSRPVKTKFLALQLTSPNGDRMQVLLEVIRCRSSGNVYDIAGRFVTRED